jgi:hypothetical protein
MISIGAVFGGAEAAESHHGQTIIAAMNAAIRARGTDANV